MSSRQGHSLQASQDYLDNVGCRFGVDSGQPVKCCSRYDGDSCIDCCSCYNVWVCRGGLRRPCPFGWRTSGKAGIPALLGLLMFTRSIECKWRRFLECSTTLTVICRRSLSRDSARRASIPAHWTGSVVGSWCRCTLWRESSEARLLPQLRTRYTRV